MNALVLPAELSIRQLEPLRAELAAAIAAGGPIVLDGKAVERVDTAALQLLCAAVSAGAQLSWQSPAEPMVSAAELLGLAHHLGLGRP